MIGSVLITLLLALIAMTPGILFCRGMRLGISQWAAIATASLAISMAGTALTGVALHFLTGLSLPSYAVGGISTLLSTIILFFNRKKSWHLPKIEYPVLFLPLLLIIYSYLIYSISITDMPNGALRVHAWYNADWFKHIGHTFALAEYGIPAHDIFSNGRPLHYYWLIYILSGAGTAIGGDGWAALFASNFIFSTLLWITFYGLVRSAGAPPWYAFLAVLIACVATAPAQTGIELLRHGSEAILLANDAPVGPSFLSFALYIPQHALALALLLGWATLTIAAADDYSSQHARWVSLAGLATIMTVSTLFGATLLIIYGLFELYRRKLDAVYELTVMTALSTVIFLTLGVVQLDQPNSAMQSPALANWVRTGSTFDHILSSLAVVVHSVGLPLPLSMYLAYKWHTLTKSENYAKSFAIFLLLSPLFIAALAELLFEARIAQEIRIRVLNLPTVSVGMIGGWFIWHASQKGGQAIRLTVLATLIIGLIAMPSAVLRALWHGNLHDRFTTIIPADDRAVLAVLRARSAPRDVVWQYPEKPYMSDFKGGDSWSVVLAGRTNVATERATDYAAAKREIDLAYRYFAGENVPIPTSVDWIYLSRKLHPKSYDGLVARLKASANWTKMACYRDACAFSRVGSRAAK